ncbi:Uncharacterized membrane protein YckC, RDD family [Amycolatopsis arida]|uniref:Uncharacterized membrane protein YckC, RDD family n=1 Tax=Amycolatopsis arida TaxID=587909 RepID=A0A1I5UZR1_9PSEU|nr:RDD family protein [Amycolatopsis arida]TDX91092.1 putative RDD family membrane protein YckC [Amycolatopsis arida]SFQ00652.1 Uncharacterized membrane protein YckC, RDD family [Amycolatopsis arida]
MTSPPHPERPGPDPTMAGGAGWAAADPAPSQSGSFPLSPDAAPSHLQPPPSAAGPSAAQPAPADPFPPADPPPLAGPYAAGGPYPAAQPGTGHPAPPYSPGWTAQAAQGHVPPGSPYPGHPYPGYPPPIAAGGGFPCGPEGDLALAGLGPVRRAGMGRRFAARLLDGLLLLVVLGALVGGVVGLLAARGAFDRDDPPLWALLTLIVLVYCVAPLIPPAYEIAMVARGGATVGKRALGIRVVRTADGALPGVGTSFLRFLVPFGASWVSCGLGGLLVYLSPVFDRSPAQQGWHDMAAKTMVIRAR